MRRVCVEMTDAKGNVWYVLVHYAYAEELRNDENDPSYIINWGSFEEGDVWYDDDGEPHSVVVVGDVVILDSECC